MIIYSTVLDSPANGGDLLGEIQDDSKFLKTFLNSFKQSFANNLFSFGRNSNMQTSTKYSLKQDKRDLYTKYNLSTINGYGTTGGSSVIGQYTTSGQYFEDVYHLDNSIINDMNMYAGTPFETYNPSIKTSTDDKGNEIIQWLSKTSTVHSLFNPYYGIQVEGIYKGLPTTASNSKVDKSIATKIQDCSIRNLVNLSKQASTPLLGVARYKYADFMYCKELGMPNNHLITLRRFATPVGDNIFGLDAAISSRKTKTEYTGDIGHLVGYFGGSDNNLSDIINYNMHGTWKQMQSEIDKKHSQEDKQTSPLGMIINTLNPQYNQMMSESRAGNNNLISVILGEKGKEKSKSWYENDIIFTNYDTHKIYEPKNTVQEMSMYEGKLEFSHSFNLVFSYKIRGYGDINGKTAMLDLLGNIINVAYSRGSFWGGRREIFGPQPNKSGWEKANNFIDKAWDATGDFLGSLVNNGFDLGSFLGDLSNKVSGLLNTISNATKEIISDPEAALKKGTGAVVGTLNKLNIPSAIKGKLKDSLGRPQLYAFNSLLTGDDTGLWHVTIGNPLNPIMIMGNLKLDDAKIEQFGPLGIDDFPTELKVTIKLSHARGRDAVDIQKMYTKGGDSIYIPRVSSDPKNVFTEEINNQPIANRYDYIGDTIAGEVDIANFNGSKESNAKRIGSNMYQIV